MNEIIISAPGKVILHGEHAVVYGKKAVAAGLNLRTFLRLQASQNDSIHIRLPDINLDKQWSTSDICAALKHLPYSSASSPLTPTPEILLALRNFAGLKDNVDDTRQLALVSFLYLYTSIAWHDGQLPGLRIVLRSNLPPGAGLGSSAAFSVCLAGALLVHTQTVHSNNGKWNDSDLDLINKWAFQAEKIIHGNPSGIDNAVSSYGGAVILQSGKVSFLDNIPQLKIMLFNTKIPRSTKKLVAFVREKYDKLPAVFGPILDSIEAVSDEAIKVYNEMAKEGCDDPYSIIKELVCVNQHLLAALGVSHPSLDKVMTIADCNGLCAKLTGAGGGGCGFVVLPPDTSAVTLQQLRSDIEQLSFDCWVTSIGAAGVTLHDANDTELCSLDMFS